MSKTTDKITVTDARLDRALINRVEPRIIPKVTKQINKAINDSKLQIGTITKFYPHLDRCEVLLNDELIICRILHRYVGDLIDYYTPIGEEDFCDVLNEPCVIPRSQLECVILDVDNGNNEQIMLGYLNSDEIVGINPAEMGNLKLVSRTPTNQYWIKFGWNGLDLRLPDNPVTNTGEMDSEMEPIQYYTKAEIDTIVEELRKEIHGEDDTDVTEG